VKNTAEHLMTFRVAGPCTSCKQQVQGAGHVFRDLLYCESCCPGCHPVRPLFLDGLAKNTFRIGGPSGGGN
jgi:hypothetical protein